MPTCKNCNNTFPNHAVIDGTSRNMQRRKFCVSCSPFDSHNTKSNLESQDKNVAGKTYRKCSRCHESKELNHDNFYTQDKQRKYFKIHCIQCSLKYFTDAHKEMKDYCVKYLGGKCVICLYDKSNSALDFHHLDPSKKEFRISTRKHLNIDDALHAELKKCILVCSNCHREIHAGLHPSHLS